VIKAKAFIYFQIEKFCSSRCK